VITARNAGKFGKGDMNFAKLLAGPEVEHYHQAVALVVAETFEQARAAQRWSASSTSRPPARTSSPR
jgi:xanthine dehydrogenase YagR molybdenum-binding subunit